MAQPQEPDPLDKLSGGLKGMKLDAFNMIDLNRDPRREALETLGKALDGDKAAKDKVVDKGAEILEDLDKARKNAKEMSRDILAKFRGKRNNPSP